MSRDKKTRETEGRGLTNIQTQLNEALSDLTYDTLQVTASDLQSKLTPFSKEDLAYSLDSPLRRFVADLEYIELLEKGGLEAVNERVAELFEQTQEPDTPVEEQAELLGKLNDLLVRGIYVFPHLARGIEIKLKPGVESRTEKFEEVYGFMDHYRRKYDQLSEVHQRKYGKPLSQKLIFPLPYGFTTGTHGSGERAAMGASQDDVYFTLIHPKGDWQTKVPALALSLEAPLLVVHHTHFTLDEIEGVRFTDEGDFVPYVDNRRGEEVLIERPNHVNYYLGFRDFSNYRAFRKERPGDFSDDEWRRCQEDLLEPRGFGNLWRENYGEKKLERGFLAVYDEDSEKVKLYELSDIELPTRDDHEAAALLYIDLLRGKHVAHRDIYEGNGVIQRLVKIPVEERDF